MATIRLVPSTYYISNTNYMSASDTDNMMTNTDSNTYGTVTHNRASTNSTYYFYLRGFNFGSVPSEAKVSSFSIKIRAKATGNTTSTSSSYRMSLYNNTTSIGSTTVSSSLSTTVTTFTFPNGSLTWDTLSDYGANFGIRIPLRRASSNTASVASIYGAEIEVTYTIPVPRTITSFVTGDGIISPSGAQTYYDGDAYTLSIVPADISDPVTATKDDIDITSSLVYNSGSGTLSKTATSQTTSGSISNSTYVSYPIGHTAESPHTYTSNVYASSQGNTAYVEYSFDFSDIPAGATISSVEVKCNGQRENASNGPCEVTLYSGTTQKGSTQQFTSTSQQTITVSSPGTWTYAELQNAKLRWSIGYYGGRLYGITWTVIYTGSPGYTYTMTVSADATIEVIIGSGGDDDTLLFKQSGTWIEAPTVYKKINGVWVQQTQVRNLFKNIRFRHGSQT